MLGPIEILGQNADGVGVINTAPEIDGVVRRMPLIVTVGGETYPSMTIETIRVATGAPVIAVKAGPAEYKQFSHHYSINRSQMDRYGCVGTNSLKE